MTTALERGAKVFPLSYKGGYWVCPKTGIYVPKTLAANLDARVNLLKKAEGSASLRRKLISSCADSMLLWINLFAMTFKPNMMGENYLEVPNPNPEVPFITWPGQDPVLLEIEELITKGGDGVIDKSRNQGASWLGLLPMCHQFLFRSRVSFKLISRKEELVDNPNDPDSLFWKLDFLISKLPDWMKPKLSRGPMRYVNQSSLNYFHGESTNKNAGRGGRRTAIFIDEAAAIEWLDQIMQATHMGATCRLLNSTPIGPGTYTNLITQGKCKVLFLPWWNHPEYGQGRVRRRLPGGEEIISSPWRDYQVETKSAREIATNVDIDHMAAGAVFFDIQMIRKQRETYQAIPLHRGDLVYDFPDNPAKIDALLQAGKCPIRWVENPQGKWKLWVDLIEGRIPQHIGSTLGADIAHGLGGEGSASNSAAFGINNDTGEQICEFADPGIEPGEYARLLCAVGKWLGGPRGSSFLAWESNGPGQIFAKHVRRLRYPWIYHRIKTTGSADVVTDQLGWHSGTNEKYLLYTDGRADIASGRLVVRSEDTLRELSGIVFLGAMEIGPAGVFKESPEAKATHADRATAAMVATHARKRAPLTPYVKERPPVGSVAAQLEADEEKAKIKANPKQWWGGSTIRT